MVGRRLKKGVRQLAESNLGFSMYSTHTLHSMLYRWLTSTNPNPKILFFVINMAHNKDRWSKIESDLIRCRTTFVRIEGVNGHSMTQDAFVQQSLKPQVRRLGQKMFGPEGDQWVYTGTVQTSFPGLYHHGHTGTKGLTMSNLKCCVVAQWYAAEWFCVLEDDSEISLGVYRHILNIASAAKPTTDVILLDKRGRGGTCAMLYRKRILQRLYVDLHPLSDFSFKSSTEHATDNLWDWKLWSWLDHCGIIHETHPVVPSGNFKSTIS